MSRYGKRLFLLVGIRHQAMKMLPTFMAPVWDSRKISKVMPFIAWFELKIV